jgi:hypothetical protein
MADDDLVVASLHLGFYLASWGMMRGSGDLLQNSLYSLKPVVQAILREQSATWALDVTDPDYARESLGVYARVEAGRWTSRRASRPTVDIPGQRSSTCTSSRSAAGALRRREIGAT